MRLTRRNAGAKKGFTLIELLVVVAIIGILAALLFPAIASAMLRAKTLQAGNIGQQIYKGLFAENTRRATSPIAEKEVWEDIDNYATSTEFFRGCIESNVLDNFSVRDFGAPGLRAPAGTNANDLTAESVAWCITKGCGEGTPSDTPFLFTKNFVGGATLDTISGLNPDPAAVGNIFKGKVGVVITFGGSVKMLSARDLRDSTTCQRYFNPGGATLEYIKPE